MPLKVGTYFITMMLALVSATGAQAQDLIAGERFSAARSRLIERGWRPVNVHRGESAEYIGTEAALIAADVLEVEGCAIDRARCIFNYARGRRCLRVITSGEEVAALRIESWSPNCPAP